MLCLLIAVLTLVVYNSVTRNAFVNVDDDRYITGNPHVHEGLVWKTMVWAFTSYDEANWHPLTWISHALDYQLFGMNPAGAHYMNVLLHAASAILLFLLLQAATGYAWRSLMVALLFALHPLNVESVAWASERKNVLSLLFFLAALHVYRKYAASPSAPRYASVALLFALGLMAKPQIITFPFVLLLWDFWPLRRMDPGNTPARTFSALVVEKIPLFALSAISAAITLQAQSAGGAVRSAVEYSFLVRLSNALVAYAAYLWKAIWPVHLAAMYPHPGDSLPGWQIAVSAFVLAALTALALMGRKHRYLPVGWFWFLGTLVPMIGLVQVGSQAMADRYAYLPLIGIFFAAVWGIADWAATRQITPRTLAVPAIAAILALGILTYRQVSYWHDSETLWTHALQVTRRNYIAEDSLGGALAGQGRVEEAIQHFRAAAEINPRDPFSHLNTGTYELQHGNLQAAIEHYQAVVRYTTSPALLTSAHAYMGTAYRKLGEAAPARENFQAALQLQPANSVALTGLGLLSWKAGDFTAAAQQFSMAAAVRPTDVAFLLLAKAESQRGHTSEAQAAYEQAQKLSPDLAQAQRDVTDLLAQ